MGFAFQASKHLCQEALHVSLLALALEKTQVGEGAVDEPFGPRASARARGSSRTGRTRAARIIPFLTSQATDGSRQISAHGARTRRPDTKVLAAQASYFLKDDTLVAHECFFCVPKPDSS